MADSPMKNHPLGIAARYNDADSEEKGFEATIKDQGLDWEALLYVVEQRAMRAVLAITDPDKLMAMSRTEPTPVTLSPGEMRMLAHFKVPMIDGILIGWRAHKISRHDVAYEPPTAPDALDLVQGIIDDFDEITAIGILRLAEKRVKSRGA